MEHTSFIDMIHKKVAIAAIGPSALRSQGASGVIDAARGYLIALDLSQFADRGERSFSRRLDKVAEELREAFPVGARNWGAARKALNLFLRDSLYNLYLNRCYKLSSTEDWYEIPLDGVIARGLRTRDVSGHLPRWRGVKYLNKETN